MTEETKERVDLGGLTAQAVDLHLFAFERSLHPELFRHFADFHVEQTRYHADVWIIGLSHVVTVTTGNRSFTELLAKDSDIIPSRGIVSRFRLKGERDHERRTPDGWGYMTSTQVETMDDALYKSVHFDLLRHAERRGWFHLYENLADGEMTPFSYIEHEARDSEFHVHAFHAYPQERTIVKTQTIIELPPPPQP
ncbi:MAG: DUF2617 family protein [Phycisphaerales bacterium]|nr:DUF2617 family protein [Phycisphaerales bacterium]